MRLDWAILSNSSEVREGLAYVLGGGWDTGVRASFPAPLFGALSLRVMAHPSEVEASHQLEIRFWNADGNDFLPPLQLELARIEVPVDHPAGWEVPVLLSVNLQGAMIPDEGDYSLEILVDGRHLGSLPFRFRKPEPPQA